MQTDACPSALLALILLSPVLADALSSTLLALVMASPVHTDVGPSTLLAIAALSPMLEDAAPSTLLAHSAPPSMHTDAAPSALLALIVLAPMLADAARYIILETCCCVATSALPQNDEAPYNCGCCGIMLYPEHHTCERYRKIVWMDRLELPSRSGSRDFGLKGSNRGHHRIKQLEAEAQELDSAGKTDEAADKRKRIAIIQKGVSRHRQKFLSASACILIPTDHYIKGQTSFYPEWRSANIIDKGDQKTHVEVESDWKTFNIEDMGEAPKVFYEYENSYGVRDIEVICGRMVADTPSGRDSSCLRSMCCATNSTVSWGNKTVGEAKGSVGDLGASANIAIEQMITRQVGYNSEFKAWAKQMFPQLCEVMDRMKQVLEPCDAIVDQEHNQSQKQNHQNFVQNLDAARNGVQRAIEENDMEVSEESRKKFNGARNHFNEAQHNYRILGDIGGCAMFNYSDQLIHIIAQIMGTMGRGFSTGVIPDEPGPPQLDKEYEGELTAEQTREEIKAMTDIEQMPLTDGMRAWAEPYAFMTCNAAHAIRSSMRLWGCMVEPNFDGGTNVTEATTANGAPVGGGTIPEFVRLSGANKDGEVHSPSIDENSRKQFNEGIQGELLRHFIEADGKFGTVEGEMRTLVEQLRTNPQGNRPGATNNPRNQFATARGQFKIAQGNAR